MTQWINARDRNNVPPRANKEPKIDDLISNAVGKKVYVNDPRVVKQVARWKQLKKDGDESPDNFLEDSKKINELKEALK